MEGERLTVDATLVAMQSAVRKGEMQQARELGNQGIVPLALTAAELAMSTKITSNGGSVVRRGRWHGTDVAVKVAVISCSADLDRFRKELRLMARMQHPNIVPLLGARALPPDYMLVMPLLSGSLAHMLHEQGWRPSWRALMTAARQLAEAVDHMHGRGVVHRDIKPANLLMTAAGAVCLADFGIAEDLEELKAAAADQLAGNVGPRPTGGFSKRHRVGTLEYMAPEVLRGSPHRPPADIYALAVTLNELATGTFPFSDCTKENPDCHTVLEMGYGRQELTAAVAAEGLRPMLPRQCPPGFRELLDDCWQLQPTLRPSAAVVCQRLALVADGLAAWEAGLNAKTEAPGTIHLRVVADCGSSGHNASPATALGAPTDCCTPMDVDSGPQGTKVDTATTPPPGSACNGTATVECTTAGKDPQGWQGTTGGEATTPPPGAACNGTVTAECTTAGRDPQGRQGTAGGEVGAVHDCESGGGECAGSSQAAAGGGPEIRHTAAPAWLLRLLGQADPPSISAGFFATAGGRESMEDRHLLSSPLPGPPGCHLAAVFDGHRGHEAASFCEASLPAILQRCMASSAGAEEALRGAFRAMDEQFVAQQECEWQERVSRTGAAAAGDRCYPGCTALAVLLLGSCLLVANAGDCRAVLCRGGKAVRLSRDHNASDEAERQRILDAGGKVALRHGSWRVGAAGLAVSRSIGDADEKLHGLIADPEVRQVQLQDDDFFVILASDGLWECVGDQDAVGLVFDTVKQPYMAAKRLVAEAITRCSRDNITAGVVFLKPVSTMETVFANGREMHGITPTAWGSRSGHPREKDVALTADEMADTY